MKILLADIETAPMVVYAWSLFDKYIPIDRIVEPGHTLCWAAKWYGDEETRFASVKKQGKKRMIKQIHRLLDECDALVTYNGKSFDEPMLNREFIEAGLTPPSPYKHIDLYQVVRSTFRFPSKKLDWVAKSLGLEGKKRHKGMELWKECMAGDKAAWAEMEEYNIQDVTELEKVYEKVLPWIRTHPNYGLYIDSDRPVCTNCGGSKLQRRGLAYTSVNTYQRYQCQDCGKWMRTPKSETKKSDRDKLMRNTT